MLINLEKIKGNVIKAVDGEIGHISDILFDGHSWDVRYQVVKTGPWLFGKEVLLSPAAFKNPNFQKGLFPVELSQDQVKNSPDISKDMPVSRQYEKELHAYYGWPAYWGGFPAGGAFFAQPPPAVVSNKEEKPSPGQTPEKLQQQQSNLRSGKEVAGYRIQAVDDKIGHVEDFLIEESSWKIRYLVIDTKNFLPGRKIIISPDWADNIDWLEKTMGVNLTAEKIKESPEYDPNKQVSSEYESQLHEHYDKKIYW
jgi:stress response protein YsnF